jgi:hypothetical protein
MKAKAIRWVKCHNRWNGYINNFLLFEVKEIQEKPEEPNDTYDFSLEIHVIRSFEIERNWYSLDVKNMLRDTFQSLDTMYFQSIEATQAEADRLLESFIHHYEGDFKMIEAKNKITGFIGFREVFKIDLEIERNRFRNAPKNYVSRQLYLSLSGVFRESFCQFGRVEIDNLYAAIQECIQVQKHFFELFTDDTTGLRVATMPIFTEITLQRFSLKKRVALPEKNGKELIES